MKLNAGQRCSRIFVDISLHNTRLAKLGQEAMVVLEELEREGVARESRATMEVVARRAISKH